MRRPCTFHIAHKLVEPLNDERPELEPDDADYIFSAKVMLMGCPPLSELYQRCFNIDEHEDTHNCVHPSRLINFLVGTRARNEPMAIGGPWSPSLDGENPDKDPAVLIRTAIRNCKALTGIDLSNCTQWYVYAIIFAYTLVIAVIFTTEFQNQMFYNIIMYLFFLLCRATSFKSQLKTFLIESCSFTLLKMLVSANYIFCL